MLPPLPPPPPHTHTHSWHTYKLLVYMHEVPDLDSKGGIRRLDRYDQLAEYVFGEWCTHTCCQTLENDDMQKLRAVRPQRSGCINAFGSTIP